MADRLYFREISRLTRVHWTTLYGLLRGRKAQRRTREKLEQARVKLKRAGLKWPPVGHEAQFPTNVARFARQRKIPFDQAERLARARLKPVESMSPKELQHIVQSMSKFPTLYTSRNNDNAAVKKNK